MTKYNAFPAVNCERIRTLNRLLEAAAKKRDDAFASRDHALEQIHGCSTDEADKINRLRVDHSIAVCDIERWAKDIKWLRKELANTIENADQEGLFDNADVSVPDWEAEDKTDDRPIGEAPSETEDTIDDYLPGRWKDQNGREQNVNDMDALRKIAEKAGPNVDIVPRISPSYGATVEFKQGAQSMGTLTYVGKANGRRAG